MKYKPTYFKIPVIGNEHFVYVCVNTRKEGEKRIKDYLKGYEYDFTKDEFEVRGKTFMNPALHPIMWVDIERDNLLATVAHESVHCMLSIFDYIPSKLNKETEEIFAICVGAIVRTTELEITKKK